MYKGTCAEQRGIAGEATQAEDRAQPQLVAQGRRETMILVRAAVRPDLHGALRGVCLDLDLHSGLGEILSVCFLSYRICCLLQVTTFPISLQGRNKSAKDGWDLKVKGYVCLYMLWILYTTEAFKNPHNNAKETLQKWFFLAVFYENLFPAMHKPLLLSFWRVPRRDFASCIHSVLWQKQQACFRVLLCGSFPSPHSVLPTDHGDTKVVHLYLVFQSCSAFRGVLDFPIHQTGTKFTFPWRKYWKSSLLAMNTKLLHVAGEPCGAILLKAEATQMAII